jgi:hypothetical protein
MQRRGADPVGQERQLGNRSLRHRRLKWASRSVRGDAAAEAFASFADQKEQLELVLGRLIVILDEYADVFERT